MKETDFELLFKQDIQVNMALMTNGRMWAGLSKLFELSQFTQTEC